MIYLAVALSAAAVGFALFFALRAAQGRMLDKRLAAFQGDLIEKQVAEVENMYRQTRAWRHDLHSHIQTMKALRAEGRNAELDNYLARLEDDLRSVDKVVKTGNVTVDAILNSKLSLARERDIEVRAKASVPQKLPVSAVELCAVVGNLLDNAMEACARQPAGEARVIRVYMGAKKERLYLCVTNTAPGVPERKDGRFLSHKEGTHGFGLLRVDRIVARAGGYLARAAEDGAFTTEVLL